ncbi:unnamed protein product [Cercospora beticola]|nr:unnamed protein product [Cercospora beticola]
MASHLRLPTLLLVTLSIILNIAIIATASHTLSVFNSNRSESVYYLPIWSSHFDMRGLGALIGTSVVILLLNAILAAALFISALPANALVLGSSTLSTIISLIGLAFPAALNAASPSRATLQTWTCNWSRIPNQGVPDSFNTLCHETRFAFYTTIPTFLLQLLLLGTAIFALSNKNANSAQKRRSLMRLDEEKNGDFEMRCQSQKGSFDTKNSESTPKKDRVRVVEVGK